MRELSSHRWNVVEQDLSPGLSPRLWPPRVVVVHPICTHWDVGPCVLLVWVALQQDTPSVIVGAPWVALNVSDACARMMHSLLYYPGLIGEA